MLIRARICSLGPGKRDRAQSLCFNGAFDPPHFPLVQTLPTRAADSNRRPRHCCLACISSIVVSATGPECATPCVESVSAARRPLPKPGFDIPRTKIPSLPSSSAPRNRPLPIIPAVCLPRALIICLHPAPCLATFLGLHLSEWPGFFKLLPPAIQTVLPHTVIPHSVLPLHAGICVVTATRIFTLIQLRHRILLRAQVITCASLVMGHLILRECQLILGS